MQESYHDIIMIGASAGGIPPLLELLKSLPAGLQASLFVVLHRSPEGEDESMLWTLQQSSALECVVPRHDEPIQRGRVYVAPADLHMLLKEDKILTTRGPRENYFRPSIDTTFRSAAVSFGSRIIGIILSGMLQDGTAGMEAIKRCGGICMVQKPEDAAFPSMPLSVLSNINVDYSVASAEMPIVLKDLIQRPADTTMEKPYDLLLEAEIAERYINQDKDSFKVMDIDKTSKELDQVARRTAISCPDCGGAIWRMKDGNVERYRCHLGHAFSGDSLLVRNKESLEESLWVALRMLEERKYVLVTLSEEIAEQHGDKAASYKERADELQVHVERIRQVITNFNDSDLNPDNNDSSQSANAS